MSATQRSRAYHRAYKTFTSRQLGISFTHQYYTDFDLTRVEQKGNKVYVYNKDTDYTPPSPGDVVTVFSKTPSESLSDAIAKRILHSFSTGDCHIVLVSSATGSLHPGNQLLQITTSSPLKISKGGTKPLCPPDFTYTNDQGANYFMMDPDVPNKFVHVKLGSDIIWGTPPKRGESFGKAWHETLQFVDK